MVGPGSQSRYLLVASYKAPSPYTASTLVASGYQHLSEQQALHEGQFAHCAIGSGTWVLLARDPAGPSVAPLDDSKCDLLCADIDGDTSGAYPGEYCGGKLPIVGPQTTIKDYFFSVYTLDVREDPPAPAPSRR